MWCDRFERKHLADELEIQAMMINFYIQRRNKRTIAQEIVSRFQVYIKDPTPPRMPPLIDENENTVGSVTTRIQQAGGTSVVCNVTPIATDTIASSVSSSGSARTVMIDLTPGEGKTMKTEMISQLQGISSEVKMQRQQSRLLKTFLKIEHLIAASEMLNAQDSQLKLGDKIFAQIEDAARLTHCIKIMDWLKQPEKLNDVPMTIECRLGYKELSDECKINAKGCEIIEKHLNRKITLITHANKNNKENMKRYFATILCLIYVQKVTWFVKKALMMIPQMQQKSIELTISPELQQPQTPQDLFDFITQETEKDEKCWINLQHEIQSARSKFKTIEWQEYTADGAVYKQQKEIAQFLAQSQRVENKSENKTNAMMEEGTSDDTVELSNVNSNESSNIVTDEENGDNKKDDTKSSRKKKKKNDKAAMSDKKDEDKKDDDDSPTGGAGGVSSSAGIKDARNKTDGKSNNQTSEKSKDKSSKQTSNNGQSQSQSKQMLTVNQNEQIRAMHEQHKQQQVQIQSGQCRISAILNQQTQRQQSQVKSTVQRPTNTPIYGPTGIETLNVGDTVFEAGNQLSTTPHTVISIHNSKQGQTMTIKNALTKVESVSHINSYHKGQYVRMRIGKPKTGGDGFSWSPIAKDSKVKLNTKWSTVKLYNTDHWNKVQKNLQKKHWDGQMVIVRNAKKDDVGNSKAIIAQVELTGRTGLVDVPPSWLQIVDSSPIDTHNDKHLMVKLEISSLDLPPLQQAPRSKSVQTQIRYSIKDMSMMTLNVCSECFLFDQTTTQTQVKIEKIVDMEHVQCEGIDETIHVQRLVGSPATGMNVCV